MQKALKQALVAFKKNEVPVGALVVDTKGVVLARGYNRIETDKCQSAHAESIAIKRACKKIGDWRLDHFSIYVTLQPCLMCFGLIRLSRIKTLVYGASSPLFGFELDNKAPFSIYSKGLVIRRGVLEEPSVELLKAFFKGHRVKDKLWSNEKNF